MVEPARRHPAFTSWPAVEGFADHRRRLPGDSVAVYCSGRVTSMHVRVWRVGSTRQLVWQRDHVAVGDHGVPDDPSVGCDWPVAFEVDTGTDWPPGFYLVDLIAPDEPGRTGTGQAYFVLGTASPGRHPAMMVLSTNTWNAYNQWGGRCMYSGAHELSFRRPLERGYLDRVADADGFDGRVASIEPYDPEHRRLQQYQAAHDYPLWTASSGWHNWERRFAAWADVEGIDLDYAIDADLHNDPTLLDGRAALITVGHSEYWSWEMRDHVDTYVDRGGNWAIFSGNTCFWQVRLTPAGTMVCHKGAARATDPVRDGPDAQRLSSMWSDPLIGRPENTTTGLSFTRGGYHRIGQGTPRGAGAYTIHRPDHWALADTGLRYGDQLGSGSFVVGYEVDGCALALRDGLPVATGEDGTPPDLEVVASAPARLLSITDDVCEAPPALWASVDPPGDLEGVAAVLFGDASAENVARVAHGRCVMGSFARGQGTIFNSGSVDWAYGLEHDELVRQITRNVIDRLGGPPPS